MADDLASYLAQSQRAAGYQGLIEEAVGALAAGAGSRFRRLLSPNLVQANGADRIDVVIHEQLVPFFAGQQGFGQQTTIRDATDGFGNEGLSFYKTIIGPDGAERPFVIYIVEEAGRPVVANVLVNTTYADRHGGQAADGG